MSKSTIAPGSLQVTHH